MAVETVPLVATATTRTSRHGWLWSSLGLTISPLLLTPALSPALGDSPSRRLAALMVLGTSVHVAATTGLFGFASVRRHARQHPGRYLFAPLALVVVGATAAIALTPRELDLALLGYFGWQFHHYQKQNLGLVSLAAASYHVPSLSSAERRCLAVAGWIAIGGLLLRPEFLQLTNLTWQPSLGFHLAAGAFAVCGLLGASIVNQRSGTDRPTGFCASYLVALYFPLPIFVFHSPYAAVGGMTIAHGLQYLLLVGMVTGGPNHDRRWPKRIGGVAVMALTLGLGLSALSHLHDGGALRRAIYGGYLGIVMTHFVVDAGLWRLRDPFPREFLAGRLPGIVPASGQRAGRPAMHRQTE